MFDRVSCSVQTKSSLAYVTLYTESVGFRYSVEPALLVHRRGHDLHLEMVILGLLRWLVDFVGMDPETEE